MKIGNITNIKSPINSKKKYTHTHFILFFFQLLTQKSFEIFPRHNGYGFMSEFLLFINIFFVALSKKLLPPL